MDGITYSKGGKTFIKVSDTPSKQDVPRISIAEDIASTVGPDAVCRTCVNSGNRLWDLDFLERSRVVSNNLQAEAQCDPTRPNYSFKFTEDGQRFEDWTQSSGAPIIAMVESCGWMVNSKCRTCAHFAATTVSQPYQQWDGGPTRYRPMTVAGHCKLASACNYKRRARAIDPSCLNCEYLTYTFGDKYITDEYDREVVKAAMDPYEMVMTRKAVSAASRMENGPHPGVLFNKHTSLHTSNHKGLYRYFFGPLQSVSTIYGEILHPDAAAGMPLSEIEAIEVTFDKKDAWWFNVRGEDHEPVGFVYWGPRPDTHFGYVRFYGTTYAKYGIKPSNTVKNYDYGSLFDQAQIRATRRMNHHEWTCTHGQSYRDSLVATTPLDVADCYSNRCSICVRSATYVHQLNTPAFADRVDNDCNFCSVDRACDAHARLLTRVTTDDSEYWYFADPSARHGVDVHSSQQSIVNIDGRFVTSDGQPAHPSRILTSARSIVDNAYADYNVKVSRVRLVNATLLRRSQATLQELVPYVQQLRQELADHSNSRFTGAIERVVARLERRISIAQSWIDAHDRALRRLTELKQELDNTLKSVMTAKAQVVASLPTKPDSHVSIDVGYGAPMSLEPFKHYCALAMPRVIHSKRDGVDVARHIPANLYGIDFREVMGDTFGAMFGTQKSLASRGSFRTTIVRKDRDGNETAHTVVQRRGTYSTDSWSDIMAMDERIRGTNPLERVQEESLINEAMIYNRNVDRIDVVEPQEWRVTRLDMGVSESADDDSLSWSPVGRPVDEWSVYTPEADRALYAQWLDQKSSIVMHNAEVDASDDITRDDIVAEWTNRWRVHGYENYRGFARRSATSDAMVFSFNHQRQTTDEVRSITLHSFVCNLCDQTFSSEEMVDDSSCPDCDVPLIWVETGHEDKVSVSLSQLPDVPKGRQAGIGFAVHADMPRYQNETRLTRMCCDNWTLRGSAATARPTRLSDI